VEGALAADCDFFAGYPIIPANEISEHMSRRLPQVGGASLAGARAMTATTSAGYNYRSREIL